MRLHLLELLQEIQEQPSDEYPAGTYTDELVVWQLGEFHEQRAADDLRRIAGFSPAVSVGQFGRTRATLVAAATEALAKLDPGTPQ